MKPTILLGLAALAISLPATAKAQTATTPKERAVIVVRHGEDLDSDTTGWIQKNKTYAKGGALIPADRDWVDNYVSAWPTYTLPANTKRVSNNIIGTRVEEPITSLSVYQHGLSAEGGEQAKYLATVLDTLTAYLGVAPISRVITKDPSESSATPNPFDTIFPYLKTFKGELLLVRPGIAPLTNPIIDKGLAVMLPDFKKSKLEGKPPLLDPQTTGSTLIVWDAEGIWGTKVGKDRPMHSKSLLTKFGTPGVSDNIKTSSYVNGGGCPAKAARLYVFLPRPTPAGNDCIVVDLVKDASGKRVTKVVAEIAVKDNDVLKSLPDRAVSETENASKN